MKSTLRVGKTQNGHKLGVNRAFILNRRRFQGGHIFHIMALHFSANLINAFSSGVPPIMPKKTPKT